MVTPRQLVIDYVSGGISRHAVSAEWKAAANRQGETQSKRIARETVVTEVSVRWCQLFGVQGKWIA